MSPGISRGIVELIDAGVLTATSAMTTFPLWTAAARALQAAPADIGLHLNLTAGAPLGPMPHLAPTGRLPPVGTLLRLLRHVPSAELGDEIGRQLDAFADATGRAPDHVDGHQHVHALPRVRDALLAALSSRGWRPWLRDPADHPRRILRRRLARPKALLLAALTRGFGTHLREAGLSGNEGFSGFSRFDPRAPYAAEFAQALVAPGPAHLVMCHPGYLDGLSRDLDPVVETRLSEFRFFASPAFRDATERANATLVRPSLIVR